MAWRKNPGRMPGECAGKRIAVELRNGMICGETPIASGVPGGWPADGKGACRWRLDGSPFDIVNFRIL